MNDPSIDSNNNEVHDARLNIPSCKTTDDVSNQPAFQSRIPHKLKTTDLQENDKKPGEQNAVSPILPILHDVGVKQLQNKSNILKMKLANHAKRTNVIRLQNENVCDELKLLSIESKCYRVELDKIGLLDENKRLHAEKRRIAEQLLKTQQLLNEAYKFQKDTSNLVAELQSKQCSTKSDLNATVQNNERMRSEFEKLLKINSENEQKLKSAQESEDQYKDSLQKVISQITVLELESKERASTEKRIIQNLMMERNDLQTQNKTMQLLYADVIRQYDKVKKQLTKLSSQNSVESKFSRRTWFSDLHDNSDDSSTSENDEKTKKCVKCHRASKIPQRLKPKFYESETENEKCKAKIGSREREQKGGAEKASPFKSASKIPELSTRKMSESKTQKPQCWYIPNNHPVKPLKRLLPPEKEIIRDTNTNNTENSDQPNSTTNNIIQSGSTTENIAQSKLTTEEVLSDLNKDLNKSTEPAIM